MTPKLLFLHTLRDKKYFSKQDRKRKLLHHNLIKPALKKLEATKCLEHGQIGIPDSTHLETGAEVRYFPADPEECTSPELQDTMDQQGFAERVLQTPENQQRLSDNGTEQEEELSSSSSDEEVIPTSGTVITRAGRTSRPVQRLFKKNV